MKDRYIYPAIFSYDDDGITVEFPDLPGVVTCGKDNEEALSMSKEALSLHLYGMEEDNDVIPEPSSPYELNVSSNQVVILIDVWMPPFRSEMRNQSVKKTLTIPRWLDDVAKEHNVNYSHLLQNAIKDHLGIQNDPHN